MINKDNGSSVSTKKKERKKEKLVRNTELIQPVNEIIVGMLSSRKCNVSGLHEVDNLVLIIYMRMGHWRKKWVV